MERADLFANVQTLGESMRNPRSKLLLVSRGGFSRGHMPSRGLCAPTCFLIHKSCQALIGPGAVSCCILHLELNLNLPGSPSPPCTSYEHCPALNTGADTSSKQLATLERWCRQGWREFGTGNLCRGGQESEYGDLEAKFRKRPLSHGSARRGSFPAALAALPGCCVWMERSCYCITL